MRPADHHESKGAHQLSFNRPTKKNPFKATQNYFPLFFSSNMFFFDTCVTFFLDKKLPFFFLPQFSFYIFHQRAGRAERATDGPGRKELLPLSDRQNHLAARSAPQGMGLQPSVPHRTEFFYRTWTGCTDILVRNWTKSRIGDVFDRN